MKNKRVASPYLKNKRVASPYFNVANVKGCPACHEMDTKKVGPAYKDIAKKYAGQKDTPDKLVRKVLEGGTGVWGNVPMPANKTMGVTEADAKKLVSWILGLK